YELDKTIERMLSRHSYKNLINMDIDGFRKSMSSNFSLQRESGDNLKKIIEKIILEEGIVQKFSKIARKFSFPKMSEEEVIQNLKYDPLTREGKEKINIMRKIFNLVPPVFSLDDMDKRTSYELDKTIERMLSRHSYKNLINMDIDGFRRSMDSNFSLQRESSGDLKKAIENILLEEGILDRIFKRGKKKAKQNVAKINESQALKERLENTIYKVLQDNRKLNEGIFGKATGYGRGIQNWVRDVGRDANIVNFGYDLLPIVKNYKKKLEALNNNFDRDFTKKYDKLKSKIEKTPIFKRFEDEILPNKEALNDAIKNLGELEYELQVIKDYKKGGSENGELDRKAAMAQAAREQELNQEIELRGQQEVLKKIDTLYKNNPEEREKIKKALLGKEDGPAPKGPRPFKKDLRQQPKSRPEELEDKAETTEIPDVDLEPWDEEEKDEDEVADIENMSEEELDEIASKDPKIKEIFNKIDKKWKGKRGRDKPWMEAAKREILKNPEKFKAKAAKDRELEQKEKDLDQTLRNIGHSADIKRTNKEFRSDTEERISAKQNIIDTVKGSSFSKPGEKAESEVEEDALDQTLRDIGFPTEIERVNRQFPDDGGARKRTKQKIIDTVKPGSSAKPEQDEPKAEAKPKVKKKKTPKKKKKKPSKTKPKSTEPNLNSAIRGLGGAKKLDKLNDINNDKERIKAKRELLRQLEEEEREFLRKLEKENDGE
ncbi:hypothetical protein KY312_00855, partial [Candidatus Woesearchaeota archaeon]|nr:hypothetical protein [Candidatus Woesearchaeota archaeon]